MTIDASSSVRIGTVRIGMMLGRGLLRKQLDECCKTVGTCQIGYLSSLRAKGVGNGCHPSRNDASNQALTGYLKLAIHRDQSGGSSRIGR